MWGFLHDQLAPDILTVGKGIGGGFPLSAVISTDQHSRAKPYALPSGSSSSYGGNPLAAAAGLATLEIILDEKLAENSRKVGEVLLKRFQGFVERFEFVGDVRGRGLMLGIELVKNKKTKERVDKSVCRRIFQRCMDRGLTLHDLYQSDSHYPAFDDFRAVCSPGGRNSRRGFCGGATRWHI